jgi:putative transposase
MKPAREHVTNNLQTYFVTSSTAGRRRLFHDKKWADLFIEVLFHYREKGYSLHEFVLMWDHFHLIITPKTTLERAVQFVKGGFSFRAKEFKFPWEIWQRGFADHRIRDLNDFEVHKNYVHQNPVKKRLVSQSKEYPYSSASETFQLDPLPQWLKPLHGETSSGTPKGVPFQSGKVEAARISIQTDTVSVETDSISKDIPLKSRGVGEA